jgi:serine/threonine-protein kinase
VLFILVAGLAGGTGWYFGAGPGSQVTIPEEGIIGQSPDAARAVIADLGLAVAEAPVEVFDPLVARGTVAGTDPAVGSAISRATVVTLNVSKGPEPIVVPEFTGLSEQAARDLATATGFPPTDSEQRFSPDVAAGVVLESYGVDDSDARVTLVTGQTYFDQRPVTFLVSAGPVPAVAGLSVADAQKRLEAVRLTGIPLDPVFDNTVPDGQVITLRPTSKDAPIAPGDSVNLVVSKGPDLVEVPNVIGEELPDARAMLEEAGFTVKVVTNVPGPFQSQAQVQSVRPTDDRALRGSEITVVSNY